MRGERHDAGGVFHSMRRQPLHASRPLFARGEATPLEPKGAPRRVTPVVAGLRQAAQ